MPLKTRGTSYQSTYLYKFSLLGAVLYIKNTISVSISFCFRMFLVFIKRHRDQLPSLHIYSYTLACVVEQIVALTAPWTYLLDIWILVYTFLSMFSRFQSCLFCGYSSFALHMLTFCHVPCTHMSHTP